MNARNLVVAAALVLASCSNNTTPHDAHASATASANAASNASAEATLDGVVVHASTILSSDLNDISARRYGISREGNALFLLVTVRDDHGDGVPADAVQLSAQSAVLPDALAPLRLLPITTAAPGKTGMTDYIATIAAKPPASVQFKIDIRKGDSNATMAFTRDLLPR
ncbi:MAG: DUF4426 domain-containing protein [Proteobacteria bacterium]|nr:DUF4426 domain-containing protein [Pseudomonadota bacterium]